MSILLEKRIAVGITGASGSVYAQRLVGALLQKVSRVYLLATDAGQKVMRHELVGELTRDTDFQLVKAFEGEISPEFRSRLRVCDNADLFSPIASGSREQCGLSN